MAGSINTFFHNRQNNSQSTSGINSYFHNLARSKRKQNEGGVVGGIGYTLGKIGTGALGILEGVTDYTVGGIAKLFGQDEYAEQLFADDKTGSVNAQLDDWYNPSKTMQTVGDVASGIGNSLVGVGVVAGASLLSGGTLTPTAAALVSGGTIGLGAAGMSTSEAYKKTGQLGAKEFGYGALSGITEAGLEAVSGAAGKVGAKLFAKKTAETVAKSSILKGIGKSFVGEAFEEGMSEFLDPYFQRWTNVDPDAKNATAQEIGYAALIGGISGALLDGVGSSANAIRSTVSGNKIVNTGKTNVVLDTAKEYAKYQEKNNTTNKAYQEIKSMVDEYEALDAKNTSGTPNLRQKRLLGDMQTANTVLAFSPAVEQSKARILANAEEFANYLNGLNIKMEDGSTFKTSAEDLRTNDALLTRYAVSDALGHILMDSKSVYDLTMSGDAETVQNKFIGGELAFMRFKEDASDAEIKEISNLLGIDIKNATYEQYIDKLKKTPANVFEDYRDTLASMTNAKRAIGEAKVKKTDVPVFANDSAISDGINVFKDSNGNYFSVIKSGKKYRVYQNGKITKEIGKRTLNSMFTEEAQTAEGKKSKTAADTKVEKVETARETLQKTAADSYARKNVKGYDELSERQKIAVRWTIMSGKANGVSDDVITAFARISADTKTNIGFADGVADGITYTNDGEHTIYLNANGTRTVEKGVMHELTHAMKGTEGYAELQALAEQYFSTHEREYNEIKERYESFYKKNNLAFTEDILSDELTAHFVEKQMENRKVLTRMTEDNPSFTKKCLSFLQRIKKHFINGTTSDADMNNVERKFLSVYNAYKTRQQSKISEKRYSLSSMSKDWGATLEEMESGAYKNKQGYKDTVVDLSINLFDNNKEKYKNLIDARRSVETQLDGIVKVAVAMKKAGLDIEVAEGSDARDTKGRSLFSSLEPNSDYVTSHDISTECNKRESFQEIYEAIIAKDPTFFYDIGNYFVIHDIMAKKGLTTPCRDCYVESMRKNLAPMAESFISMLHPNKKLGKSNAAKRDRMIVSTGEEEVGAAKDGGYIAKYGLTVDYDVKKKNMPLDTKTLNVRMLTTEDGIATLRTLYPEIYEQFNGYYGQAKPKLPRRSAPYRFGELTAMFSTDKGNIKKSLIEKIVAAGGLRFQSYSDFKLKNTTDVLQVILEAESLGLTGQTYTKVPAFLDVVGDTNMKVNISIFTENVNEAEELKAKPDPKELTWKLDKLESFPMSIDDIYEKYVQADKNGNTTIIDVVQNVSNAAWAMVNDKIGYVIPYHKSGMQMEFKRNKKGQRTAIDHTAYQNEKIGAKRVKENLSFHKYWWEDWANKQSRLDNIMAKEGKNGVIKAKLTHYFDECAKDGRKPKFYDIYLAKDITDICKAQAEKLGLNLSDSEIYFEYKAKNGETWKVPYGYYKFLGDYQVFKPDGTESMPIPLTLDGYDFDELASRFSDKESIARTELLQQVTDKENFANKSNEEISSEIKKRRAESAEEALNGKRYALPVVSPVEPTSSEWKKTIDTAEAKKRFPKLWDVTADSSEVRNPTQITSTVSSYNKIYDILAKENFTGRILDASSGLGYGTMSGRDNYGFDVDDIEPYPDASYSPKYKDYTKLDQNYDVIISNAVLNVLPQDQRDSLVKTMGDHLNDGGRLFINVRGDDVNSLAKNENNVKIGNMEWYVANTGSYQKGFTSNELVSYLKDALGSGFTVEPSRQFGKVSAIVTKDNSAIRYALPDGINVDDIEGGDRAMTELPQDRLTLRDVVTDKSKVNAFKSQVSGDAKRFTEGWQIMFTNAQAGLERVIKSAGIKEATAKTNYVRAAKYAGMNAIDEEGGQYTLDGEKRVGDSLVKIWSPIYKGQKLGENYKKNPTKNAKNARYEDYQQKFNLYLLHQHNVDRYAQGKMVLGEDITPEVSEKEIAKMDEAYPEFRAIAEKTWKFTDNLLQLAVDSGMYSQEYVDNLRKMYPHYVPTYREEHMNGVRGIFGSRDIAVNAAKKRAKGADTRVLPIDDVIARMTIQRYSSSRINKLLVDLANGIEKNKVSSEDFRIISSEDSDLDMDNGQLVDTKKTSGGYQVTFYRNGKRVTAEVSKAVFSGIDAFAPSGDTTFHNVLLDGVAKVNRTFKKLVTSLNPFFSYFRNPLRDIQDAGLYTRYPLRTFAKNYARARKEITGNGTYWQEAKAAGITSASVFDYEKGITTKQKNKVQRIIDRIEATSNAIEMAPRLAEYISARESGKSVQEALLEAQDVTTNFGRGGVFAKKLNSTIMPFLNPAIQGFSKMVRAYTGKDAAQSYVNLIIRSVMLGVGMAALNDLMNDDDEDYQNLSDYVKETNYVLSLGDGEFLKIPKGRVVGVFGEVYLRSKWYLQGDKKAYDGLLKSLSQQVTPVDNFSRTIFSPIMDLKNNKTWYGGEIESQKWENTKPSDRYDESTSSIAIWLGKVFDYSPLKINYLLDQYGGVVTDIILPATSTQAETGIVSQNLLVNSTTNSKWSSKFYDTLEEYNYRKTDGDIVAAGVVKYLNGIRSTISDMNKQISEIQQSDLSDDEKIKQEKIIQAAINALEKDSLTNAKYLEEELRKYNLSEDTFNTDWRDAVSTTVGEDYALKTYNKDVYSKAKTLSTGGIGMGTYYDYYFDVKNIESDKNQNGEAVSGSKKAKVIAYTWQLDIPDVQKLMLIMSSGYTITDNDINRYNSVSAKRSVAQYITQLNISKEEKLELARTCGLTVIDNKIIIKK